MEKKTDTLSKEVSAIYERIEFLKNKTEWLRSENPEMKSIEWHITDIPYSVFDEFRQHYNRNLKGNQLRLEQNPLSGKMYCRASMSAGQGADILVWSKPVKIKTTYEVIESKPQP